MFETGLVPLEMDMRFETPLWLCYHQEAVTKRSVRIAIAFLKHVFNRHTTPRFGEHFAAVARWGAVRLD